MRRLVCSIASLDSRAMPTVRFEGRVLPEVLSLTINNNPAVDWVEGDLKFRVHISIQNGAVAITFEIEKFDEQKDYQTLIIRALDVGRATINLVGFSMGTGFSLSLERAIMPSGKTLYVVMRDHEIASKCTAFSVNGPNFDEMLRIVLTDTRLYHALRDLIEGISIPHLIAPRCANAIETLRVCIAPDGASRKDGWIALQDNLRVSEGYLRIITDHSRGPRHGDHHYVPATTTVQIGNRSWVVMNRFLEYRRRGDQPLPLSEFPLLTG